MRGALVIAALLASCGPPRPAGPPPEYPGALTPSEAIRSPRGLGDAFALEQRVEAQYPDGTQSFRAVLQLNQGQLVLVGFGPHGGRGFVLTQVGGEVEMESHLPQELPFPPDYMLRDIQRVWFGGLQGPLPDGEHTETVGREEIVERWEGGRLMERTYRRLDGEPPGELRATYEGGLGPEGPPPRVVWDNGWFGYRLILATLSHQRLTEPTAD